MNLRLSAAGFVWALLFGASQCIPANAATPFEATIAPLVQEVLIGESAAFTATVNPTGDYAYQWYFNGRPLLGRTGPSLRVNPVVAESEGTYRLAVSDGTTTLLSPEAQLTVWTAPKLLINGQTNVVPEGAWSRFEVRTDRFQSLAYQWRFNDQLLESETNASLIFEQVTRQQSGIYSVTVSNAHAGLLSQPYVLQTTPPDHFGAWHWRHPLPQGNDLESVAFADGVYVAVGGGGALMTSTNGVDWSNHHTERWGDLRNIIHGDAGFIAVGSPSRLITSPDGEIWTAHPVRGLNPTDVAFGNGTYVVLGQRMTCSIPRITPRI